MRRTMILMVAAALLVALVAGSAAAKGKGSGQGHGGGHGKGPAVVTYVFEGTVEAVAGDGGSLAVDVAGGNKAGRQHLGGQTFTVTPDTKINADEQDGASLDRIGAGYDVVVQSKALKGASSFGARVISASSPEASGEVSTE